MERVLRDMSHRTRERERERAVLPTFEQAYIPRILTLFLPLSPSPPRPVFVFTFTDLFCRRLRQSSLGRELTCTHAYRTTIGFAGIVPDLASARVVTLRRVRPQKPIQKRTHRHTEDKMETGHENKKRRSRFHCPRLFPSLSILEAPTLTHLPRCSGPICDHRSSEPSLLYAITSHPPPPPRYGPACTSLMAQVAVPLSTTLYPLQGSWENKDMEPKIPINYGNTQGKEKGERKEGSVVTN